MRIVIVDDQKTLCNGIAQYITQIDDSYKIVGKAYDGHEGEKLIRLAKPDIAFLDIRMPFLSGIQLLERLRGDKEIKTKYIMLTAYSDFEYVQQALRLGAFDYMLKPVRFSSLETVIQRAAMEFHSPDENLRGTLGKTHVLGMTDSDQIQYFIESYIIGIIQKKKIRGEYVVQALRIIGLEYMLPLSLNSIALRLDINESYLSRIFSADVGMPLVKFLNILRLDIAIEIMKKTELNVTDIAKISGFDNITYFGRLFKNHTGYSASSYRQIIQQSGDLNHGN